MKLKERHKEVGMILGVLAVCALLGFFLVINPAIQDIRWLHEEIGTGNAKADLYRQIVSLEAKISRAEKHFTDLAGRPILIAKLSDLAAKAKVELEGVNPRTLPAGYYDKLELEADVQGTFFSLLKYLQALEVFDPLIDVQEMSFTQVQGSPAGEGKGKGPALLQGKLLAATYLKKAVGKS